MIQIITINKEFGDFFEDDSNFIINSFKNPRAFDEFDINILDLSFNLLWVYRGNRPESINIIDDLKHYKNIIRNANNSKILVILPQNLNYIYWYSNGKYQYKCEVKNLLNLVQSLLIDNIYEYYFQLEFETTQTKFKKNMVKADFHFLNEMFEKEEIILNSDGANKATTIKVKDNLFYTTLDITGSKEIFEEFLVKTKMILEKTNEKPKWIEEVNILDDEKIRTNIQKIENEIKEKEKEKEIEIEKLNKNNKIKSILYETDKSLQKEVIEILNKMLDYKDNNFVDEMEEDYRIKKEDITFIIETKGLSRNIKGEDISKTLNHVEMYEDKIEEDNIQENVKGIYIVATQRNRRIEEREKTPDRQLKLAERNNILIIRTEILLKLYENFKNGKIKPKEIIELLMNRTGELKLD